MTEQTKALLERRWREIQKSHDHFQAGIALLEKAEMDLENAIDMESGALPEADKLAFGACGHEEKTPERGSAK